MTTGDIFKCIGNEREIIPGEILEKLNISYEDSNRDASKMAMLSNHVREYKKRKYCILPFCHTVEAEALGSTIILDPMVGNRVYKYSIDDINLIDKISPIDLYSGRISKVLEAIKKLKDNGEKVCLAVIGPISLATSVMDSQLFYRALRKDRETVTKLLKLIEDTIVEYILEGIKQGVDIISFADPTGTIDIVGPKVYKDVSGKITYNILKRIENQLGNTIVHLCGKTSTSLENIGFLETNRIKVEGCSYGEMLNNISKERDDIKFVGHWCIKSNRVPKELIYCKIKE